MFPAFRLPVITLLLISVTTISQATAQQTTDNDPRVGKKILVTVSGAELKTPKETVWRAYLGEVFTVSMVNGEWLWIAEKQGWMWEKQGIPFDSAIQEASQRVTASPTAENYHLRGVAYLAHRQYENAVQDFTASLQKVPNNAGALNNRGQAYYLQQQFEPAIADFSKAVSLDDQHFVAFNNRALAYIASEKFDSALPDLQAALKIHPKYPEALNNRGVVRQKLGQTTQAIADFTEALKLYPGYIDALGNRAFAYRVQGDYQKAVADLRAAIEADPLNYEPVNDLAWVLATAKQDSVRDGSEALNLARKACEMSQFEDWNTLDTLAAALAETGDFKTASEWILQAIEEAPDSAKEFLTEHQELIAQQNPIREEL
jgi:tetratricopeptide (TPR) repeat protein